MSFNWHIFWKNYIPDGLITDTRATLIGAIVGWLIGIVTVAVTIPEPIEHFVQTNVDGYAQPLGAMIRQINQYDKNTKVTFEPDNVSDVFICESAYITGNNYRDVFLKYIDRYAVCLDLNQISQEKFVVRPNRLSGAMLLVDDEWHCKCQMKDRR